MIASLLERAEAAYRDGALGDARAACLELLRRDPRHARALYLMASVAAEEKNIDEGLAWARRAQEAAPRAAAPHYAMGRVWEAAARFAEAEASYRRALELEPADARAHNNLGAVLHMQGRLDEALESYRRALEIDPAQPQANQNYAAIVRDPASQQRAIEGYLRHMAANPNDAAALRSLGNLYAGAGRAEEALDAFERALAIAPGDAATHFAKASLLLSRGEYAQGWKEYEWRWKLEALNATALRFAQPMWNGEPLPQGTVLMHGETGLGDMLQLARYAPLVAARCRKLVLECQPPLKRLLADLDGPAGVIAQGEPLPGFDAHVPIIRLPYLFGTTLDTIPWRGPYVRARPELVAQWQARLGPRAAARVGLAWTGNPRNLGNLRRSLRLAQLAPLGSVPGIELHSLQVGPGADEAAAPPSGLRLVDHTAHIRDFADTAALVAALDLVVTVDTSIAHLAGAMAAPTWVLLSSSPDWRYHTGRGDNPWYPTMRLYRQRDAGDWPAVVDEVAAALRRRNA